MPETKGRTLEELEEVFNKPTLEQIHEFCDEGMKVAKSIWYRRSDPRGWYKVDRGTVSRISSEDVSNEFAASSNEV